MNANAHRPLALAAALAALSADPPAAPAQVVGPPRLVADLAFDEGLSEVGSDPRHFVTLGGNVFFTAVSEEHGREWWMTDGTSAGTRLAVDLLPGPDSGIGEDWWRSVTVLGDSAVFPGRATRWDWEPWAIDATGTARRMADVLPGAEPSAPRSLRATGGFAYFGGEDRLGTEPWRTDGTPAGTVRLADIAPGIYGSYPGHFTAIGSRVVFSATAWTEGTEPHVLDATGAVSLLADLRPGEASSEPRDFTVAGSTLFFTATTIRGRELVATDGTPAGTRTIDLGGDLDPTGLTELGGALLVFTGAPRMNSLWRTDGTPAGTWLVRQAVAGTWGAEGRAACSIGSVLVFAATDPTLGMELWISDGTPAGTRPIRDMNEGTLGSSPSDFACEPGRAWLLAGPGRRRQVWTSDGTPAGTNLAAELPERASLWHEGFHLAAGRAFFSLDDGAGHEPWVSDGTQAGTRLLLDIRANETSSDPEHFVSAEGVVALSASPAVGELGRLHLTDGTRDGTILVTDAGGTELWAHAFQTSVVGMSGRRLLVTLQEARAPDTTAWFVDLDDGLAIPQGVALAPSGARVGDAMFVSYLETSWFGEAPGRVDGLGFSNLLSGRPSYGASVEVLGVAGGRVVYEHFEYGVGGVIRASDVASLDPAILHDELPGPSDPGQAIGREVNGRVVFGTLVPIVPPAMWATDGTNLERLCDGEPWREREDDIGGRRIDGAELPGGRVVMTIREAATGFEPWVTDGTAAGTFLLADLMPGEGGSIPSSFASVGSLVVFAATDDAGGTEPFVTDGTPAGTRRLLDIVPGPGSSNARSFKEVGPGLAVFSAWSAAGGREAWITDGTAAGTVQLPDVVPGAGSSAPDEFESTGRSLVFAARGGSEGRELWAFDLATAPEAGHCANEHDDDGDGAIDCDDSECATSDACNPLRAPDADGDGVPDVRDCAPFDPSAQAIPAEPSLLVRRIGSSPDATLSWNDVAPAAGSGTRYDVAGGALADLRAWAPVPCLATGLITTEWTDTAARSDAWYIVRGANACGPAPGFGWGTNSYGMQRPGCP